MGWGRWRLAALALAALGLLALLTSCTSPGAPLDGLTEAQRQARPLAVAWAWDLRLTRALWQQALATSEVASRAQPDVPEGAQQAARALRYRDAVRQSVSREVPEPFHDAHRVADLRRWGTTAVALLAEAEWMQRQAQVTRDAGLATRAQDRYRLAEAAMAHFFDTSSRLLAEYRVDPMALEGE